MFLVGNFIMAAATVLDVALSVYMWIIIISALISWVNPDPYNLIVRSLYRATEPVLRPIRRLLRFNMGLDFSPMIAILGVMFLKYFLIASLKEIAIKLR